MKIWWKQYEINDNIFSKKYINNYLVYHNFVNYAKESRMDKEQILFNHILNTDCISKVDKLGDRPSVPLIVV